MEFTEYIPPEQVQAEAARESVSIPEPLPSIPISALTQEERERQRRERDALLDALEAEEEEDEELQRAQEEGRPTVVQELRDKAARVESKSAVKVLKTIGKTPLGAHPSSSVKATTPNPSNGTTSVTSTAGPELKPKKSVAFAGISDTESEEELPQASKIIQAKRTPGTGTITMKYDIVERFPAGPKPPKPPRRPVDSDDEDVPDEGADGLDEDIEPSVPEDNSDDDSDIDLEEAMQQREIALRYHELRQRQDRGEEEDEWDKPVSSAPSFVSHPCSRCPVLQEVPHEATLASKPSKAGKPSRFMDSRINETKFRSVVPGGIPSQVRPANVVNGKLEADVNDDSDDELDPRSQRILEGLLLGRNVEEIMADADAEQDINAEPPTPAYPKPISSSSLVMGEVREAAGPKATPALPTHAVSRAKVSRFKANRIGQS